MRSLRFLFVLLFAAFASAALVLADAGALGQNSNSSTTEEGAQDANMNANMSAPRRGRRGRRGTRRPAADANANATTTMEPGTTPETSGAGGGQTGDLSGEQADLSGTYTGRVTMTGGHEMSGEGTLTITGNSFTLASEGMTHNGRVYAINTRGYVGAAFYFTDIQDPTTSTPVVANVRARKSGDRLTLSPAPGSRTRMTFGAGGGTGRTRRGRRPAATPEANANTGENPGTTPPR